MSEAKWIFWAAFTNLGGGVIQGTYIAWWAFFRKKHPDAIINVVNLGIEMFFSNFNKVFHYAYRPFWVNSNIRSESCSLEFGNPSAHSIMCSFFTMYLFNRWVIK